MDIRDIKALLSGPRVRDIDDSYLNKQLSSALLKIYTLAGLTKNYTREQLKDETSLICQELAHDLRREGRFSSLRAQEILYALQSGLKGDLGDLKTFGLNYQTFYKWLAAYMDCQDRSNAMDAIVREMNHKQLAAATEPTKEEQRRMIIAHINEAYRQYKSGQAFTSPQHISNLTGVQDLGGVKDRFLTAEGLKPAGMSLVAYFDKCKEEGKEKIL